MEISERIRKARSDAKLTQDDVAESIYVSRQTISNWENGKSYPDIVSIIKLSDLYNISLDDLLKGDLEIMEYLKESTNVVKSNKKLYVAIAINGLLLILLMIINGLIKYNLILVVFSASLGMIGTTYLFYQIIKGI